MLCPQRVTLAQVGTGEARRLTPSLDRDHEFRLPPRLPLAPPPSPPRSPARPSLFLANAALAASGQCSPSPVPIPPAAKPGSARPFSWRTPRQLQGSLTVLFCPLATIVFFCQGFTPWVYPTSPRAFSREPEGPGGRGAVHVGFQDCRWRVGLPRQGGRCGVAGTCAGTQRCVGVLCVGAGGRGERKGGGGRDVFICCLRWSFVTIDHAPLSRRSFAPTPTRDTFNGFGAGGGAGGQCCR